MHPPFFPYMLTWLRRGSVRLVMLLLAVLLLAACSERSTQEPQATPSATPAAQEESAPTNTAYPEPQEDVQERPQPPGSETTEVYPAPQAFPQNTPTQASPGYPEPLEAAAATNTPLPAYPEAQATATSPASYPGPQATTPPAATASATPQLTASPTAGTLDPTNSATPASSPTPAGLPTASPTRTVSPTPVFTPTPSRTAPPLPESGFRDDFDWELDENWKWYYPDEQYVSLTLSPGYLRIYPQAGGLPDGKPRNLFLANAPQGDFEISTQVFFEPDSNYQFAGLVVYTDERNALQFGIGFAECEDELNCLGRALYFSSFQDGAPGSETIATLDGEGEQVYLRIRREGKNYRAEYSLDAIEWQEAGVLTNPLTPVWVGLFTGQSERGYDPAVYAEFDFFRLSLLP